MKIVDRIEGETVYLEEDGVVSPLPLSRFDGVKEGDVVREKGGVFYRDERKTKRRSRRVNGKLRRLIEKKEGRHDG